jgi:ribonuclease D
VDDLRAAGRFGFDTEFVGEDAYRPEVCLVQVAFEERQALIDPLSGLDTRPFWQLVADPAVQKIVHAGSEDLALCRHEIGQPAANVIDLQVAAGLVGLGYPASLSRLARSSIGAKLHKSQTLTDWRRRPLSEEQIDYAVQDVMHLPAMHRVIHEKLEALGRVAWATEECAGLCAAAAAKPTHHTDIRRLRGAGSLGASEAAIAEALLDERDKLARELDRPARAVLRDHLLVELARRGWTDPGRIRSLRGLNLSAASLKRVAAVVEAAKGRAPSSPVKPGVEGDTQEEEVLLSLLTAVLREHCNQQQISYTLLAAKEDLRQVVRRRTRDDGAAAAARLMTGWRGQSVGDLIERVMSGRARLRVVASGRKYRLEIVESAPRTGAAIAPDR